MTFRRATLADLDPIMAMGQDFMEAKPIVPPSLLELARQATRLITQPDGVVLLTDEPISQGMLGAVVFKDPWSGLFAGQELFFWVRPECRGRGFLRSWVHEYETWANDTCQSLTGDVASFTRFVALDPLFSALLSRLGYAPIEIHQQKGGMTDAIRHNHGFDLGRARRRGPGRGRDDRQQEREERREDAGDSR